MSNYREGYDCYLSGDTETREWFEEQWKAHPDRVHEDRTTNYEFHYGGAAAFRKAHEKEPEMSDSFSKNEKYMMEKFGDLYDEELEEKKHES